MHLPSLLACRSQAAVAFLCVVRLEVAAQKEVIFQGVF